MKTILNYIKTTKLRSNNSKNNHKVEIVIKIKLVGTAFVKSTIVRNYYNLFLEINTNKTHSNTFSYDN